MQWLRRNFITGFFVTVPLFITVLALIWIFGIVDGLTGPMYERLLGRRVPGLGLATTALGIVLVGAFATNVIGKRLLQRGEQVVLVEANQGYALGFLTKEFTVDRGAGAETLVAVYVPTNHLYLGDIVIVPRERALFPDISVEEGLRIFLTGGMALPPRVRGWKADDRVKDFRV